MDYSGSRHMWHAFGTLHSGLLWTTWMFRPLPLALDSYLDWHREVAIALFYRLTLPLWLSSGVEYIAQWNI